jgi:hypothetical protein
VPSGLNRRCSDLGESCCSVHGCCNRQPEVGQVTENVNGSGKATPVTPLTQVPRGRCAGSGFASGLAHVVGHRHRWIRHEVRWRVETAMSDRRGLNHLPPRSCRETTDPSRKNISPPRCFANFLLALISTWIRGCREPCACPRFTKIASFVNCDFASERAFRRPDS